MWSAAGPPVVIALIAGGVSLVVTILTNRATSRSASAQAQQTQFKEVIAKRMEVYPKLWRIHIHYETNWTLNAKPKTREWAQEYVDALNEFNLDGGVFFSQDLYQRFGELRRALYEAIDGTAPGETVSERDSGAIRFIVYGGDGAPGLSTFLKDDLGSYRSALLQRRADRPRS